VLIAPPSAQPLIFEPSRRGVSMQGARQLVAGDVVRDPRDSDRLAIIAAQLDPSDPSGNTVFVSGASGGVWRQNERVSLLGTQQFLAGLPVTDVLDRQRLAQLFTDVLGHATSRTRLPWNPR